MASHIRAISLLLLLVSTWPGAAMADPIAEAVRVHDTGDYARAFKLLHPLAQKGDPRAQHILGEWYDGGNTGTKEYITLSVKKARHWYEKSAAQNYKPGVRALGAYLTGHGIEVMRGYRILLTMAEAGDARAQALLGNFIATRANEEYPERYRIPGTAADGLAWLHKAANQKDNIAAYALRFYHWRYGTKAEQYYWELITAALMKSRLPMAAPNIRDELTKKQRTDVERRAAAWLKARGVTPVHRVESK
ncbi:MAG TPA: hypothetical protein VM325_18065 [Alphaproteobacteria bacterium]|nr:hypothetical protein [Alphaproteobacteria bacterium]